VKTTDKLRDYVAQNFGDDFDEAWTHYGAAADTDVVRAVGDAFGDAQFSYGARSLAREIVKRQHKTFRYLFTHAGAHTSDRRCIAMTSRTCSAPAPSQHATGACRTP